MTSLVRYIKTLTLLWGVLLFSAEVCSAQSEKVFSIAEFVQDPFDLSGRGDTTKMVDGSGYLYSIVKVSSDDPEDKLSDYRFDFGMLKSIVKVVDGELWVYVQKNAKQVSVSRQGYKTVHRFDLGYTLESGAVYRMKISVKREAVGKAMLQFKITPAKSGIAIMYTNASGKEGLFGITDDSGSAVKYLEMGVYTYKIVADYYHPSEGYISLKTPNEVFVESVNLRPNYAEVELVSESGVEIFIDSESKGNAFWKGILNPGSYKVECRKENYRTSVRTIEVSDGEKYKFTLDSPEPIVGTLVLTSNPLGASVTIDGKNYGVTPLILDQMLIGSHIIILSRDKYESQTKTIVVKESETIEENITLVAAKTQSSSASSSSESGTINGHEYVDLGLPSGLKWATCNVGASSPEEYGGYYAWGEVETKNEYYGDNSKTYGKSMSDISGNAAYDVARAKWGGSWRLPTKKELEELESKCTWKWTTQNGKKGYKVTGPNGNSIFLPAAGYRNGSSLFYAGEYGHYWSSSSYESSDDDAYYLYFYSSGHDFGRSLRSRGRSVRSVSE